VKKLNLDEMPLADLKQLKKDVERAINSFEERRKSEAAAELEALAREKGFTLAELTSATRKRRKPVQPKYRHPENAEITWSGRGRKPKWVIEALNKGKSLDDLAI
jgi:DNA-binding protein H-NS